MGRDTIIERKVYPLGESIFKQGSTGRTAYIVQKGSVDIIRTHADGSETLLGNVGVGGMFGEMAVIDESPRMAGARVAEAATVIVVTEQMFQHKLKQADPFIRGLLNIMADTIRSMGKKPKI
ncbi:MAG: cyclic nucleotide-binding domain-containing protein [Magnetovibrio sp.]|nr:cyclic nucleotide-binding domain-containing protein [Magnetovibrio sp.]